ncbi:MAG TPA: response regulator [Bacteroidales bacterium]|nr:response regulator [Bacteroidales bacterium]
MSLLERITGMFSVKTTKTENNEEQTKKLMLISTFSIISLVFFILFDLITIIRQDWLHTAILSLSSVLLFINLLILRKRTNLKVTSWILFLIISVIILILQITGGTSDTGYIWLFTYPVLSIFLLGIRKGSVTSAIMLLFSVILYSLPVSEFYLTLNAATIIRIFGSYAAIYLLTFLYEYIRIKNLNTLELKITEAKEDRKIRDEFISKLSHQIRTPLNNIMVLGNLVSQSNLDENQKDQIDTIIASANNLVNVVNNIVKVSTPEITDYKENITTFNLTSTINNIVRFFREHYEGIVNITSEINPDIQDEMIGDPVKLKQILLNLIENITKQYEQEPVNIIIRLQDFKSRGEQLELSTEIEVDRKLKIVTERRETFAIENMYFNRNHDGATFVDLSIVKRIIEKTGGKMQIKSSLSTTTLIFPLIFRKAVYEEATYGREKKSYQPKIVQGRKVDLQDANILLVEDNLINQKIVILSLKKMVNNIDIANNGKEALDKFGNAKYDLILMDIQMPVMDGIIATKKIREIEESTSTLTPIIAITANALAGDKETCLAAGMNDYVSKPFQVEVLLQKMRDLLTEPATN